VLVSNPTDDILSASAILTLTSPTTALPPVSTFNVEGFVTVAGGVTGGGLPDPSDAAHYKVIDASTPSPAQTLRTYMESVDPLVIELRTDVDLGVLNNQSHAPLINPELIASGLGVIRPASNKTLFSANAATLRHGSFTISGASNIIIRNLRFHGLWEWDDATSGAYDLQSWDYFTIQTGSHNIWIDHCEFGKSYDGLVDIVHGSDMVTVSWSRFSGDLGTEVADQINYLESLYQANPADSRIVYYKTLRQGGQSVQDIITHEIPQDKGDLVGNDDSLGAEDTGRLNVTFHHNAYVLVRQRTPRMRFGNAHVYNMLVDDTASAAFPGTQTAVNSTMNAAVLVENSYFLEVKTPYQYSGGGRVSDRGGFWQYLGVPQGFDPTRLSPVNPADLVWNPPLGFVWPDLHVLPYTYTLDPVDFGVTHPERIGVIAPGNVQDEALLRSYLPMTIH
jgi:pectate lyase